MSVPNIADVVTFCILLFFLLDGWRKGFFKSAIGPMALIVCALLGMVYFDLTKNFIKAISFTITGTLVLTIISLILLAVGQKSVDPQYRDYSPVLSRILGGIVNVLWQGAIFLIVMCLIALAPLQVYGLAKTQNSIQQSVCYSYVVKYSISQIPALQRVVTAFSILQNPDQMQRLASTPEFQMFFLDKKVQALVKNNDFMASIKKKDLLKVIANPKIFEIFDDDSLMENFGQLAARVYALDLPDIPKKSPDQQ